MRDTLGSLNATKQFSTAAVPPSACWQTLRWNLSDSMSFAGPSCATPPTTPLEALAPLLTPAAMAMWREATACAQAKVCLAPCLTCSADACTTTWHWQLRDSEGGAGVGIYLACVHLLAAINHLRCFPWLLACSRTGFACRHNWHHWHWHWRHRNCHRAHHRLHCDRHWGQCCVRSS